TSRQRHRGHGAETQFLSVPCCVSVVPVPPPVSLQVCQEFDQVAELGFGQVLDRVFGHGGFAGLAVVDVFFGDNDGFAFGGDQFDLLRVFLFQNSANDLSI